MAAYHAYIRMWFTDNAQQALGVRHVASGNDDEERIRVTRDIRKSLFEAAAYSFIRAMVKRVLHELFPVVNSCYMESKHLCDFNDRHGNMPRSADDYLLFISEELREYPFTVYYSQFTVFCRNSLRCMHRKEPGLITHPDKFAAGYDHLLPGMSSIADREQTVFEIYIQFTYYIIKAHIIHFKSNISSSFIFR